jgi:hypothetical protein
VIRIPAIHGAERELAGEPQLGTRMSDRKRTIDDIDDVDDEDGAVMEEDELDTDLTLRAADPEDVTGPGGTIARDDEPGPPDPDVRI